MLATIQPRSFFSSRLLFKNVKIRIYKTKILPVVLHGCETWSLTLREVHKLGLSEHRMPKKIFGPKTDSFVGHIIVRNL
jgi:hypothetical protein